MGKCQSVGRILPNLLLQILEEGAVEKLQDGDFQSVADFFDGSHGCGVVPAADDVVQCGLGQPAHSAELVHGQIPLLTQLQYPYSHRFADTHGHSSKTQSAHKVIFCSLYNILWVFVNLFCGFMGCFADISRFEKFLVLDKGVFRGYTERVEVYLTPFGDCYVVIILETSFFIPYPFRD